MLTKKAPKSTEIYLCEECDFKCSKQCYWDRHIATAKHMLLTDVNKSTNFNEADDKKTFDCTICSKVYKSRVGLWKHTKVCTEPVLHNIIYDCSSNEIKVLTNLVLEIVKSNTELQKQNHELQKQVFDVCQKIQPNNTTNINNSHNNSHNKTFNLQFFLNEQCKDAMNIMDFVNTFQLQFSDLERIGEVGYVQGISNIVIDKLNEMDIHKRPIHCSDAKREIMYVKDKDVWEKENANNDKIRLALKHITKKNSDLIRPWANAHPGVLNSDHRLSDKYQEMIIEAMGGNSGTIRECETKIIKKISKMVLIDKGH